MSEKLVTGSELKLTLQALGLTAPWFANRMSVTMRTVVRWFDSDVVPVKAGAEMQRLQDMTLQTMKNMVRDAGDREPVTLSTYRTDEEFVQFYELSNQILPASWHRALTFRVVEHLRASGRTVTVVYNGKENEHA
jgi:hypothetical protein